MGEENTGQGQDPRRAAVWGGQQHGENSPDSETTIRRCEGNHLCQEKARWCPAPGLTTEPLDLCTQVTVPFTFLQEQSDWEKKAGCKVPERRWEGAGGSGHEPLKEPPEGWRGERSDGTLWTRPDDRECERAAQGPGAVESSVFSVIS